MSEVKKLTEHESFLLMEYSRDTIATMLGFTTTELIKEAGKENPDQKIIADLNDKLDKYSKEQSEIYAGDEDVQRRVIDEYHSLIIEAMERGRKERAKLEK